MLLLTSVTLLTSGLSAQDVRAELQADQKKWLACDVDILFTPHTARSDFTAEVVFRGAPMTGVSLTLRKQGDATATKTVKTDSKGIGRFSGIPAGDYYLSVEEMMAPNFAGVKVAPDSKEDDKIVFEWPNVEASARTLYGKLLASQTKSPLEGAQVELLELRTSRVITRTYTDAGGNYFLDAPARGVYVLRFIPQADWKSHRDFGVEFSDDSKNKQLPTLQLESNDCGVFVSAAT